MNSREIVKRTLEFRGPDRVPRQLWTLPWAEMHHREALNRISLNFPDDIVTSPSYLDIQPKVYGEQYKAGEYIDEWGCKFTNLQDGIIGEVKEPIIRDEEWQDSDKLRLPVEWLSLNRVKVNEFCRNTDKFVIAGACPRPFEQLQFIRGTEQLYVDLMLKPEGMLKVISRMHEFYCSLLTKWAETDVDCLMFMDDWGSQRSLLINPKVWEEIFKPIYKDYIDIAHKYNKKIFMHSDGYILEILPKLIELGLDAINSQIFCIGLDKLEQFKGKITFWGEIDRQHLLPYGSIDDIERAVHEVKKKLWKDGGCIAQCEFGPGAKPENVYKVFEAWNVG